MELIKLETMEQLDKLKKGDLIIVRWKPGCSEYKKGKEIGHYPMLEVNRYKEIILRKRDNTYFNFEMYLRGESYAEDVFVLMPKAIVRQHKLSEAEAVEGRQGR